MKALKTRWAALAFALGAASLAASSTTGKPVLPWIEDDYGKALVEARTRNLPIFVENWAPW